MNVRRRRTRQPGPSVALILLRLREEIIERANGGLLAVQLSRRGEKAGRYAYPFRSAYRHACRPLFHFLLTTCSKENQDHKKKDLRSPELNEISEMPTEKRISRENWVGITYFSGFDETDAEVAHQKLLKTVILKG